jgi:hypothetical protein
MSLENQIQNVELLTDLFGCFPSFHDSEVVQLILDRKVDGKFCPTLTAKIRVYNSKINSLVTMKFTQIFGLKLENFNHQNVLGDLKIEEIVRTDFKGFENDERLLGVISKSEIEQQNFKVKFEYCFGIEADFLCSSIIIEDVQSLPVGKVDYI